MLNWCTSFEFMLSMDDKPYKNMTTGKLSDLMVLSSNYSQ